MPKLIQKSGYIKPGGKGAGRYAEYIATRDGVELMADAPQSDRYLKYIAERPRSHGLFSNSDSVSLEATMAEIQNHSGNVWTLIYSLKREDAARLGYDSAGSWRKLIRAYQVELAEAMKIPPKDFRWCAAASSRTSYHSLPRKRESSFISSLLLFAPNPLRWASAQRKVRYHKRYFQAGAAVTVPEEGHFLQGSLRGGEELHGGADPPNALHAL